MNVTAYCVGYIDKATGKVLGAAIFSEPNPTTTGNYHQFPLFELDGASYAIAAKRAEEQLKHWIYNWLGPITTKHNRFERRRDA